MKLVIQKYFSMSGIHQRIDAIKENTGIDPVSWQYLKYKNLGSWFRSTLIWINLLETAYFNDRITKRKQQDNTFYPKLETYIPIFHETPKATLDFLKKLDTASIKATGDLFPDFLFETTLPPNGGPYLDLLNAIHKEGLKVPHGFIDHRMMYLGLQFSRQPKDILDLRTITKRDILFLAKFLCKVSEDKNLSNQLLSYIDNEEVFGMLLTAIKPEKTLQRLDFEDTIVDEGLDDLRNTIILHENNPKFVNQIYRNPG